MMKSNMHIINYGDGPRAIYEILKKMIISGELAAGSELKIMTLAAEMQVSTITLREAIRMLAAEKIVTLRPRRSPIVAELHIHDLVEMNRIRAALEPVILVDAVHRHTPETIRECAMFIDRSTGISDAWDLLEMNKAFHLALLAPSRLRRSIEIIAEQFDGIIRLTQCLVIAHDHQVGKIHEEHAKILDMVRAGNAEKAATFLTWHIDKATKRAEKEFFNEENKKNRHEAIGS